jgi:hypothetical protein
VLPEKYEITSKPPPSGKDYNDYLCSMLNISCTKPRKRER